MTEYVWQSGRVTEDVCDRVTEVVCGRVTEEVCGRVAEWQKMCVAE